MNPQPRTRATEIVRGLGALTVLALLLVGFPIVLHAVAGSPIPDGPPTWSDITATLMRPDTDHRLFLAAVRLAGWTAWALLVTTITTETIGYLAGRSAPSLPRPIRPMQHLARDLIAMAALTFGATAAITNTIPTTTAQATTLHPHPSTLDKAAVPTAHRQATPAPVDEKPGLQPPGQASKPSRWRTRVIKQGDTLWGIARHHYGSGHLFPKIFKASKNLEQPPGLPPLTNPDHLHPGQRVRLPDPRTKKTPRLGSNTPKTPTTKIAPPPASTSPPAPATPDTASEPTVRAPIVAPPPTAPPANSAAPAPSNVSTTPPAHAENSENSENDQDGEASAITLPTGTSIGLGLATALSIALAATRLHRRRRHHPHANPSASAPEAAPPAVVAKARKAHLDTYIAHDQMPPTDAELVAQDLTTPAPDHITIGIRDRQPISLPLPGLHLGLTGQGAPAAARAIATELLAVSHRDRAELILTQPDAHTLFPGTDITELASALPGLTLTPTLTAAITHLETELIHRARLLETTDQPDLPNLRTNDPAEPLPTLLLITSTPDEHTAHTLHAITQLGHRHHIGALIHGPCPTGTTAHLTDNGTVTHAQGPHADTLTAARLFHTTPDHATGMLHTIRTATGQPEPPTTEPPKDEPTAAETGPALVPPPRPPNENQQLPVQLRLLGPIRLHTTDGLITTGLRRSSQALLAYLALHTDGITRDQGTTALWSDHNPDTATTMFHTAISNIRKVLRAATGLREPMFVIHTAGRYRLDPHLIDPDLWRLTTALIRARHAENDAERTRTLRTLATLYTAEFATDLSHPWAEAHREYLRRTVIDALARLAQLIQDEHPDEALTALEHAIHHDPYAEPLYRTVMQLQAQLGHPDAAKRTYQLLTKRLAELDTEPDDQTHKLLTEHHHH